MSEVLSDKEEAAVSKFVTDLLAARLTIDNNLMPLLSAVRKLTKDNMVAALATSIEKDPVACDAILGALKRVYINLPEETRKAFADRVLQAMMGGMGV